MTMKIVLAPQFEEMVREKVVSGLYTSASEVVHDALRLMHEHDQVRIAKLAELRHDIQAGLDSGPVVDWDPDEIKLSGRARSHPQWCRADTRAAQRAGCRSSVFA
ncbi:type II toxin-antitoxin system ParD family antitoxin [Massilia violaceinigra]|uniref:Type II toxin-antitoxin system ParD family antitoxin n=1 Tax=Massilia violaceinigra TaxID=2045208 RepID=A0A2D2DSB6_9BURK|nr:type II toxin-antitoxin system ParD family antitoxin [Massilia violaceinigra]ATQ77858.1 type II toxin-antitoxin system ParD family antitoxin [Massilia violaceinigra]